jgi:hypothetical protein
MKAKGCSETLVVTAYSNTDHKLTVFITRGYQLDEIRESFQVTAPERQPYGSNTDRCLRGGRERFLVLYSDNLRESRSYESQGAL